MMRSKQDKMIHKHMVTLAVGRFIELHPMFNFSSLLKFCQDVV